MTTCAYPIAGGDYERAGAASRGLKDVLKALGLEASALRRLAIAAYEAEMNVVIHARRGRLTATVDPASVTVVVEDEGPGIPDVARALEAGFSTAPPEARALGFGAGLGLPNIRKQVDELAIETEVGRGTRLRFAVAVRAAAGEAARPAALRVDAARCRRCGRCVTSCPTGAARLRPAGPTVLAHLCIECTACIGACPDGALGLESGDALPGPAPGATLVASPAVLAWAGAGFDPAAAEAALAGLGITELRLTTAHERAVRAAALALARPGGRPILTPACPAVVELIRSRFPALLDDLAPLAGPLEAAAAAAPGGAAIAPLCPAGRTVLLAAGVAAERLIDPVALRARVRALLHDGPGRADPDAARPTPPAPPALPEAPGVVAITGLRSVLAALEELEDGRVADVAVLELHACEAGCFGAPALGGACGALALARWARDPRAAAPPAATPPRVVRRPRAGLRLDPDIGRALELFTEIAVRLRQLPGRDCGQCGAPSCQALAEDVVLGRASETACPHRSRKETSSP